MRTIPRFHLAMYRAALRFYGLPEQYNRTFTALARRDRLTQQPLRDARTGKPLTMLAACESATASKQGRAVWVQINVPFVDLALTPYGRPRKARNEEIEWIMNMTLDFEYPACPSQAHVIGRELVTSLIAEGIAEAGLPIEDSGAGCHLVLPLVPIKTTRATARQWNEAVREVVKQYIQPRFAQCVARRGLALDLGGFDISRLLSVPGTWRPPHPQKKDSPALRQGYLRRWLPPYVQGWYPTRVESQRLTHLIREAYRHLTLGRNGPRVFAPGYALASRDHQTAAVWLANYAAHKSHSDRSALFQSLVSATYLKYGEGVVLALKEEIDRLSGGKYEKRLEVEIERSLQVARRYPTKGGVLTENTQMRSVLDRRVGRNQETIHAPDSNTWGGNRL